MFHPSPLINQVQQNMNSKSNSSISLKNQLISYQAQRIQKYSFHRLWFNNKPVYTGHVRCNTVLSGVTFEGNFENESEMHIILEHEFAPFLRPQMRT